MTDATAAGAAPAITPAVGTLPAAATPPAGAAPAPGADGFTLPTEIADWGASKGYSKEFLSTPDAYKLATSYRESEKLIGQLSGGDKIALPKDMTDFTSIAPVLDKLGAPKSGADYKLPVPAGGNSDFYAKATNVMAENKLLPAQAANLTKWFSEQIAASKQQTAEQTALAARDDVVKLETEWAGNVKINSEIASRGFNKLAADIGMTPERAEEIRNGNNVTLTAYEFAKLSKAYGDLNKVTGDTFEGGEGNKGGGGSGHTPESAKAEINRLTADPAFAKRLFAKDADAKKQLDELYKIAGAGIHNPT